MPGDDADQAVILVEYRELVHPVLDHGAGGLHDGVLGVHADGWSGHQPTITETDRERVRAAHRPGTAAVLAERPHTASELTSHVTHLPGRSEASGAQSAAAEAARSARQDTPTPDADHLLT
nr:hypothetical protein StreXyl84_63580 [Streptomyces sp. Xyl84]